MPEEAAPAPPPGLSSSPSSPYWPAPSSRPATPPRTAPSCAAPAVTSRVSSPTRTATSPPRPNRSAPSSPRWTSSPPRPPPGTLRSRASSSRPPSSPRSWGPRPSVAPSSPSPSTTPTAAPPACPKPYGPDDVVVHQQDVQGVVNALWAGGAEAMQIMDQRVISTSAVRCVGNTLILQGRVYSPPYDIKAIGNPDGSLKAARPRPPGADLPLLGRRVRSRVRRRDHRPGGLPGYDGTLDLDHAPAAEGRVIVRAVVGTVGELAHHGGRPAAALRRLAAGVVGFTTNRAQAATVDTLERQFAQPTPTAPTTPTTSGPTAPPPPRRRRPLPSRSRRPGTPSRSCTSPVWAPLGHAGRPGRRARRPRQGHRPLPGHRAARPGRQRRLRRTPRGQRQPAHRHRHHPAG